ncbi:MAG TPA: cell surface protein [Delftia acidovorans]|nr:cell surface protein [Delftia acidovorans]
MKKNVLALSIATMIGGLGFAGAASAALAVNESGTGHILVVPYYTAQNGNATVFHLTNTDLVNGKAVKVRFRGASNSDDVLDFQVFLSPGDVWTAAVSAGADGLAQLVTGDNSCTVPKITPGTAVPFIKDRLTKASWTETDKNAQTREGYIEILNMADISAEKKYDASTGLYDATKTSFSGIYTATKHVNGKAPCTSAVLDATVDLVPDTSDTPATAGSPANFGLRVPTGGLAGSWYVINVPDSTTFSGSAAVITATAAANNLYSPQVEKPATLTTADPLLNSGIVAAQHYDVPDLSTPLEGGTAEAQAGALSDLIGRTVVANQFVTDATISAKTDWVFSMPTRRYVVAANYAAPVTGTYGVAKDSTAAATTPGWTAVPAAPSLFTGATQDATKAYRVFNTAVAPGNLFNADPTNSSVNAAGQICATAGSQVFFDREETSKKDGAVFSPGTTTKLAVCGEVSVVTFGSASVLGASLSQKTATTPYADGWGYVTFGAKVPLLGSAFQKGTNPNASAGMIGNYGVTWPHVYSIK